MFEEVSLYDREELEVILAEVKVKYCEPKED